MSEPQRWLDDESSAPPGARELLAHARRTAPIDKRTLSVSAMMIAKLAATPTAAAALPLAAKLVASLAMVTVASAIALQVVRPTQGPTRSRGAHVQHAHAAIDATTHPRPSAPLRVPVQPLASAAGTSPEPATLAATEPPPVAAASLHANLSAGASLRRAAAPIQAQVASAPAMPQGVELMPATPADPLALEVTMLDAARALLAQDAGAALSKADAHAKQFPDGALSAERELIAIDALHRLGRQSDAQARADSVLRRFPGSLYRERLRTLLRPRP